MHFPFYCFKSAPPVHSTSGKYSTSWKSFLKLDENET